MASGDGWWPGSGYLRFGMDLADIGTCDRHPDHYAITTGSMWRSMLQQVPVLNESLTRAEVPIYDCLSTVDKNFIC